MRLGGGAVSLLHLSSEITASRLAPSYIPEKAISKGAHFLAMLNHLSIYNARAEHVSDFHDIFSFVEEIVIVSNCDAESL